MSSKARAVSKEKLQAVDEIAELCAKYSVIGLVKMTKMGSSKITDLRTKLRGTALIRMAKKSIIKRAFEKVKGKPGLPAVMDRFTETTGPSALVFTNLPALKIRKILDANMTTARAKIGEVMEKEIVVKAGNTKLPPGPAITELNAVGLATKMQDGTIWVTKDSVLVKAGQAADSKVVGVMTKLKIEPINVVLDLYVAYENGEVVDKNMLSIDYDKFKTMFIAAYSNAKAVALKLPILIPELMKDYLAKAQAEALAVNAKVTGKPLVAPAAPAQAAAGASKDKKEEPKEEEKKEEVALGDLFG